MKAVKMEASPLPVGAFGGGWSAMLSPAKGAALTPWALPPVIHGTTRAALDRP